MILTKNQHFTFYQGIFPEISQPGVCESDITQIQCYFLLIYLNLPRFNTPLGGFQHTGLVTLDIRTLAYDASTRCDITGVKEL